MKTKRALLTSTALVLVIIVGAYVYSSLIFPKQSNRNVTGGWTIHRLRIGGVDRINELPQHKKLRFWPESDWTYGVPLMDLQPLPTQEESEAKFNWKLFGKDSVNLLDNRYGVISGNWRVFLYANEFPHIMVLVNNSDTIVLEKQHVFMDPTIELYVD